MGKNSLRHYNRVRCAPAIIDLAFPEQFSFISVDVSHCLGCCWKWKRPKSHGFAAGRVFSRLSEKRSVASSALTSRQIGSERAWPSTPPPPQTLTNVTKLGLLVSTYLLLSNLLLRNKIVLLDQIVLLGFHRVTLVSQQNLEIIRLL